MPVLHVQLLGDFQIRYDDQTLDGFDAPRLQSLLAYLLFHRDAPQSRKHLAFLLWQDSSEKQAQNNLRNLVYLLRKAVPDAGTFFFADAQELGWNAGAPYTLDAAEFENLTAENGPRTGDDGQRMSRLSSAAAIYRGDLLPACYDEWVLPERERLREKFIDALAQLIALHESAREFQQAIHYARRLLQADPLSEETYRKLMQLHARLGERANVVRVYQTCAAVFQRELDTEPSAATRDLFEQLRHAEPAPEILSAPRVHAKHNLPAPLTSFVGRTRELAETRALLERARLVTLTGVGGGGKTRLALQSAQSVAEQFADGAWFVDLAPLSDPADVARACANVLNVREQTGASMTHSLIEHLRAQELLLVPDNCEHLLGACAELARAILEHAPRVKILATSREPLNLLGEALLVVPPLSLPDLKHPSLEAFAHSDAVQLFAARASFLLPTFTLHQGNLAAVAQICQRLDGIPLAIELAAARIRTLSPAQIAARLDDALAVLTRGSSALPTRHQTMRAVLDWSDALLSEQERVLFRRLAVFAGGFTLEAAEQICADDDKMAHDSPHPAIPPFLILDLLSNLIDKSLVTVNEYDGEIRYRMLAPIREYARDKLQAAREYEGFSARHLRYFVMLAEQADPELRGPQQGVWMEQLAADHDNLRVALSGSASDRESIELRLRMAGALWRFWDARGNHVEGKEFLQSTLREGANASPATRIKAYTGLGTLEWLHGDYDRAILWHEHALALSHEINDSANMALAQANIGGAYLELGDFAQAGSYFEAALELARKLDDRPLLVITMICAAEMARYQGDYARAQDLNQEAYGVSNEIQYLQHAGLALNNLGLVARLQGDFATAIRMHRESLQIYRACAEIRFVPECLEGLAAALEALAQSKRAAILLGASDTLRATIDLPVPRQEKQNSQALVERLRNVLQQDFSGAWDRGRAMPLEQVIAFALDETNSGA